MSSSSKVYAMAFAAATLLASTAMLASAQVVRVRLLDAESRQPLAGVLVSALTAAGAIGPSALSSGDGVASVRFTGSAPERLLIRHIGFAPVTTDPVVIPVEIAQAVDIVVPAQRITLNAVHVLGDAACSNQTASPSAGAQDAWTQVRTALEASTLTRDQRLVTTAGYRIQRQVRLDGTVDYADTALLGKSGERPFVAPAPAALERDGYFRQRDDGSEEFYAPDEAVLLSPGFTAHHCVRDVPETHHDSTGTQIALAFVPRDRDTRAEIKGLIWLDSATSELRRVDFEYVRVPLPAPADSLGGSVAFRHLASGAWIVSAWMLRIPQWRVVDRHGYVLLDGYREVGGTASVVRDLATPGPSVPRTIAGTVFDSIARRPLRGAHVRVVDLDRETISDSTGAFRFDSVGVGVHTVWADHPTLDTLGLFSLGARADVTPQVVTNVSLVIPSFATLWHRICGSVAIADSTAGFVFGVVRADSAGAPRPAAVVHIAWRADSARNAPELAATATADSTGNYVVCGVPGSRALMMSARDGAIATRGAPVRLGTARIAHRDLVLSATATVAEGVADTSGADATGAMHTLRVVSPDGKPVVYANVSLGGGTTRITNEKGELPLGAGRIHNATTSVKRIGFAPWFGAIDFPDTASVVTITLTHVAQYLGEVRITGQKNPSSPFVQGFYDRWLMRQKGLLSATFIGPEELEFRHSQQISDMLRGVNGVNIAPLQRRGPMYMMAMATDVPNCPMAVVIDGKQHYPDLVPGSKPPVYAILLDQLIPANDIMAIEVYARGGNMPISLQVNDTKCGVIAFWTGSRH
ncbi:MAG: carboxypeptidase regulatory-like domain-containing protein [Gemmatimonadales bacterium]